VFCKGNQNDEPSFAVRQSSIAAVLSIQTWTGWSPDAKGCCPYFRSLSPILVLQPINSAPFLGDPRVNGPGTISPCRAPFFSPLPSCYQPLFLPFINRRRIVCAIPSWPHTQACSRSSARGLLCFPEKVDCFELSLVLFLPPFSCAAYFFCRTAEFSPTAFDARPFLSHASKGGLLLFHLLPTSSSLTYLVPRKISCGPALPGVSVVVPVGNPRQRLSSRSPPLSPLNHETIL